MPLGCLDPTAHQDPGDLAVCVTLGKLTNEFDEIRRRGRRWRESNELNRRLGGRTTFPDDFCAHDSVVFAELDFFNGRTQECLAIFIGDLLVYPQLREIGGELTYLLLIGL